MKKLIAFILFVLSTFGLIVNVITLVTVAEDWLSYLFSFELVVETIIVLLFILLLGLLAFGSYHIYKGRLFNNQFKNQVSDFLLCLLLGSVLIICFFITLFIFLKDTYQYIRFSRGILMIIIDVMLCLLIWLYYSKNTNNNYQIDYCHLTKENRFTLVAREVFRHSENGNLIISGKVYGDIYLNDLVYLYLNDNSVIRTRIIDLTINDLSVNEASNELVEVTLEGINDGVKALSVISSIEPNNVIENVKLSAYILDYEELSVYQAFLNQFNYEIIHGQYLVKYHKAKNKFNFYKVHDQNNYLDLFAIFTDWHSFVNWHWSDDLKENETAVILSFPEIVSLINLKYDNVVINPFGPKDFVLSKEFISSLINTKGYRNNFGG